MNVYAPHKLWAGIPTSFPTNTGGKLILTPQKFIPYSFTFYIKDKGEETDVIGSTVRLTDSEGKVWAGDSIWHIADFIDPIGCLGALNGPALEKQSPEEYKRPFEDGVFFSGAHGLFDDRFYRKLLIGPVVYTVPMKYQGPCLDLAFHSDPHLSMVNVYARVSQLYGYVGAIHGYAANGEETIIIPPFIAEIDIRDRLFINYYIQEDGENWEKNIIPKIVVFQNTGELEEPNSLITSENHQEEQSCH